MKKIFAGLLFSFIFTNLSFAIEGIEHSKYHRELFKSKYHCGKADCKCKDDEKNKCEKNKKNCECNKCNSQKNKS